MDCGSSQLLPIKTGKGEEEGSYEIMSDDGIFHEFGTNKWQTEVCKKSSALHPYSTSKKIFSELPTSCIMPLNDLVSARNYLTTDFDGFEDMGCFGHDLEFGNLNPRACPQNGILTSTIFLAEGTQLPVYDDTDVLQLDEHKNKEEVFEKIHIIEEKFLGIVQKLGLGLHDECVANVLYRLRLPERLSGFENSCKLRCIESRDFEFSCTILVLGKYGAGKSATINSIFKESKVKTSAFQTGTTKVQEIVGTVNGIKIRVIDTPGLKCCSLDQSKNQKILNSVKSFIRRTPPDVILYVDRLDCVTRESDEVGLLQSVMRTFGLEFWSNAIIVFTHAASQLPDGPFGYPISYDMFVFQRSQIVKKAICQAAGDMFLVNHVSLVENHASCKTNIAGEKVLPNGQIWRPKLLLNCFALKIIAERNAALKPTEKPCSNLFEKFHIPQPLSQLASILLENRSYLISSQKHHGNEFCFEDEYEVLSDSDEEEKFYNLPPFKRLSKCEIDKLTKEQRKAYFAELDYREELFLRVQWKEELRQRQCSKDNDEQGKDDEKSTSAALPLPDMALPLSFDADYPSYRYRFVDAVNDFVIGPVLGIYDWDHDIGYEGLSLEKSFMLGSSVPFSVAGQFLKNKKEKSLQLECSAVLPHGRMKTNVHADVQALGNGLSCTFHSDTRLISDKHKQALAGIAINLLGGALSGGVRMENSLMIGKRLKLVINGSVLSGQDSLNYGSSIEATVRSKEYPLGHPIASLGLSLVNCLEGFVLGYNLQSETDIGRNTKFRANANMSSKTSGSLRLSLSSSDNLKIALLGIIPIVKTLYKMSVRRSLSHHIEGA